MDQHAIVVGASRGIGGALVRALLDRVEITQVFGASRDPMASPELLAVHRGNPSRFQPVQLDVTDEKSIRRAVEEVRERTDRIHLLLVTAGILHGEGIAPEKRLEAVDPAALQRSFAVNSIGPLLIGKHFWRLLRHHDRAVFGSLSARVRSIGDNRAGGWYGYRASKAAQNMVMKTLSIELGRRAPNLICVSLHPGTVETHLSAPFGQGTPADKRFSPDLAARQLLTVIDRLGPEDSGAFIGWDGQPIPW
jgi:NAD(P)-dependent dehydrogenase (short-subunit alcohol dehydrogenase family)